MEIGRDRTEGMISSYRLILQCIRSAVKNMSHPSTTNITIVLKFTFIWILKNRILVSFNCQTIDLLFLWLRGASTFLMFLKNSKYCMTKVLLSNPSSSLSIVESPHPFVKDHKRWETKGWSLLFKENMCHKMTYSQALALRRLFSWLNL